MGNFRLEENVRKSGYIFHFYIREQCGIYFIVMYLKQNPCASNVVCMGEAFLHLGKGRSLHGGHLSHKHLGE